MIPITDEIKKITYKFEFKNGHKATVTEYVKQGLYTIESTSVVTPIAKNLTIHGLNLHLEALRCLTRRNIK